MNSVYAQRNNDEFYAPLESYPSWTIRSDDNGIKMDLQTYPASRRRGFRVSAGIEYIKTIEIKNEEGLKFNMKFRDSNFNPPTEEEIVKKIKDYEKKKALERAAFQKYAPGWGIVYQTRFGGRFGALTIQTKVRRLEDGKEIDISFLLRPRTKDWNNPNREDLINQKIAEGIRKFEKEGGR